MDRRLSKEQKVLLAAIVDSSMGSRLHVREAGTQLVMCRKLVRLNLLREGRERIFKATPFGVSVVSTRRHIAFDRAAKIAGEFVIRSGDDYADAFDLDRSEFRTFCERKEAEMAASDTKKRRKSHRPA